MKNLLCLLCLLSVSACQMTGKKDHDSNPLPKKIDDSSETTFSLTIDNNLALKKDELVVSIPQTNAQSHSAGNNDKAPLTNCFGPLPGDMAIGKVTCSNNSDTHLVQAKHVRQKCSSAVKSYDINASEDLSIEDCKKATLTLFSFEPALDAAKK